MTDKTEWHLPSVNEGLRIARVCNGQALPGDFATREQPAHPPGMTPDQQARVVDCLKAVSTMTGTKQADKARALLAELVGRAWALMEDMNAEGTLKSKWHYREACALIAERDKLVANLLNAACKSPPSKEPRRDR